MRAAIPPASSAPRPWVAAVDQGSSSTKGALLDSTGTALARAESPVAVTREGAGAAHDPEELLDSVRGVLAELSRAARPDAVALACQRSTCLLWERDGGRPLTPALSWQDLSAASRVEALAPRAEEVARRTGLRLSPHYAGAKLGLLLDELPGARARAGRGELLAGTLDAFLVHRLTGRPSTEPGHAGRTLLYALDEDRWDDALCALFAVPASALPELLPSAGARGTLAGCGPALDGLPLLALVGDQQAALVGGGGSSTAAAEGRRVAVAHFGTGAFVLADTGEVPRRPDGLLAAVTWSRANGTASRSSASGARRFQLEGSVNSAGSAVDWALRLGGADLVSLGAGELDPERLPLVLPAFVGLGAPWWRPRPGATVAGLTLAHGPRELLAATLAGVAQRVVDCLEAFAAAGLAPTLLRTSGRLASLPALATLLANLAGLPVEVAADEEAGLRGAARLANLALGADPTILSIAPPLRSRHEPQWEASRRHSIRDRWRTFVTNTATLR